MVWEGVLVEPLAGDHSCFADREVYVDGGPVSHPRMWNLATGAPEGSSWQPCTFDRHYYWRFTVGRYGDRWLAVSAGPYSYVDVWDVATGRLLVSEEMDDGHKMMLGAVTVGTLDGQSVIVTSGFAGAVTIWSLADRKRRIIETGSLIRAVALDGRSRVIVGGVMGLLAIDSKRALA